MKHITPLLTAILLLAGSTPGHADVAQSAYLKAAAPHAGDLFGHATALDGNTLIVGAPYEDGTAADEGAVYVFVRADGGWVQQARLKANNPGASDLFGLSVSLAGDTLVVGAQQEDSNATTINGSGTNNSALEAGAAYVFVRSGTTWTQQAYLKASNTSAGDLFGISVSISGETAVVGARDEDGLATNAGAAYIFVRSGTAWSQQAILRASNGGSSNRFGSAVALSGNTMVAGAYGHDGGITNAGAAYVFVRSGTTWSQQAYLLATNRGADDLFGLSVAISGETIVVGARDEDSNATGVGGSGANNSAANAGAAYVFTRSGTSWGTPAYLKASNTQAGDQFSEAVAIHGDTIVVGSLSEDSNATGINGNQADNSAPAAGAAYVFTRSGSTWSQLAYLKASNTGADDLFAAMRGMVAVSGSLVACGAVREDSANQGVSGNGYDDALTDSGAAYVFTVFPWRQREPLPVYEDLHAVAVSETKAVAVGARGCIATSVDGEVWQAVRAQHGLDYRGVAFSTSGGPSRRWVAVGGGYNSALAKYETTLATAAEGDEGDWRDAYANAAAPLNAVTYHNGRFVAVGALGQDGASYRAVFTTSVDGWNWMGGFTPSSGELISIAAGNGIFVAVGGTNGPVAYRSTNGSTWTGGAVPGAVPGAGTWRMHWVGFVEGRFVATASNGAVFTSIDGSSWQAAPLTLPGGQMPGRLLRATGRSVWLHANAKGVSCSDDDQTWSPPFGTVFANPYPFMSAMTFFNGTFLAVGTGGIIQRSPDAAQWRQVTGSRTPAFSGGVAEKDGLWLAAGSYFNDRCLQASADGIHWHLQKQNPLSSVYGLKTALGRFVAVGRYALFQTSLDGVTWDSINIPGWAHADRDLTTIGSSSSVLLAAGQSEIGLLRSTDGLTCTRELNPFPGYMNWSVGRILHGAGRFVLFGSGQRVADSSYAGFAFQSTDGLTWTEIILPGLGGSSFYGGGGTFAQGQFVILDANAVRVATSPDGLVWTVSALTTPVLMESELIHDGKRFLAASGIVGGGALWQSPDGVRWTRDYGWTGPVAHRLHHHAGLTVALTQERIHTQGTPSLTPAAPPVLVRDLTPSFPGWQYPEGPPLVLSVTATGRPAPQYQWTRNGQPLSDGADFAGTQSAELTIRSLSPQHAGDYRVTVSNTGGTVLSAMHGVAVAAKQNQTITFAPLPNTVTNAPPFALTATASSNLPVRYESSDYTIATVRGGVVTLSGVAGSCVITAWQTGDATAWRAAAPVTQTLTVITPSSEARLISLMPGGITMLAPAFNSAFFFYTAPAVDASVSGLPISASSLDMNATITANGVPVPRGGFPASAPAPLQYGTNFIAVICTAQDGTTTRTYTLSITRLTEIQSWRRIHFGTTDQTGYASDPSDPDFDGLTNRVEFAFGLNPNSAASAVLPLWTNNGTESVIAFAQPAGVGGITYAGEWSTSLSDNPADWTALPDTGTAPQHRFAVPVAGRNRLFLRVRVENAAP